MPYLWNILALISEVKACQRLAHASYDLIWPEVCGTCTFKTHGPFYYGDPYTTTWFSDKATAEEHGEITAFKIWHLPYYVAG